MGDLLGKPFIGETELRKYFRDFLFGLYYCNKIYNIDSTFYYKCYS